jgi:hypothetical protein
LLEKGELDEHEYLEMLIVELLLLDKMVYEAGQLEEYELPQT